MVGRLNGLFSAANVLAVKSITGGAAGSSSTLQPLFYGVDTATAAVFSSVRALTPPWGVAHEQAYVWARRPVHLHICACVCVFGCVYLCASSHLFESTCISPCSKRCSVCAEILQISELDATVEGKKKHETLQHCRPLIKSLKYASNLHKNLSVRQRWIFFPLPQCAGLYFSLWCRPHSS